MVFVAKLVVGVFAKDSAACKELACFLNPGTFDGSHGFAVEVTTKFWAADSSCGKWKVRRVAMALARQARRAMISPWRFFFNELQQAPGHDHITVHSRSHLHRIHATGTVFSW
jgi:hypothetical protein